MNLRELKLRMVERFTQVVVFHKISGKLIDSCDSLARLEAHIGASVYDLFPLVGSMQEVFARNKSAAKAVCIPCVEFSFPGCAGMFDFTFHIHPQQDELLVWTWVDQTEIYEYLRKVQQERNILLVEKEDRETGRDRDRWEMAG